ncbi:sigma-70 family RNA polymerase sigma factor [Methylomicrobium sp. RS1]|nr:sigma-70 family RNA polymerase sigma factor [Methylomicrobium sp. RS1]
MPDRKQADMDEYVLLQRIVEGDASAFEVFYKHYYPRLFRFILRTTRQAELVEELIQETLLFVWEKPERFNYESKISTWVFGIAYHKALKAMAKTARRSQEMDMDELDEIIGDPMGNLAETTEIQDWLDCALDQLSVGQRAVIELTFQHGLAYQDIAKILGCPENTVKTRMFHARKKLHAFAEAQEN